ncbi:DUF4870 domain-containing protein [Olleya aquimaris]|uniref:DUF4870 domain-containing protein n=1 Tax=Olleya sediminilitoris TaxID=2795739 RepID=A0ABS1WHV0_9FLAO|nr:MULTISPECIES: DUF4870 domain-containing protein [Olleya]AXO79544.1 DUF4870 domain-containing protein [Olleya aquimaris]MBL7558693.1 DUF4870 domain-containing protein [Olleya sediminilitoris]
MKTDRQLLVLTHLSQLVTLLIGCGSLILPFILWITQKDRVYQMDTQGKAIVNFQLSLVVLYIVCVPLILLFGLGLLGWFVLGLVSIIYPVLNAIKVSNGQNPEYPLSFNFIS